MKALLALLTFLFMVSRGDAGEVVVRSILGEVSIRHGVTESWSRVSQGDVLRPHDTMKTGKHARVVLIMKEGATEKRIVIPEDVMLDLSDLRQLSQKDLMLKLTMEKVRGSSYQWKNDDLRIPNAPVVHGSDRSSSGVTDENGLAAGRMQWNGAQVLFTHGFYSTCALRTLEVLRRYPALGRRFEERLLAAEALEMAQLRNEALTEYVEISNVPGITLQQHDLVQGRINNLRKQSAE